MPATDINTGTQTGDAGLALGLNGIADFSTQMPFLDIMKTARPWTGHLEGQWGGMGEDDLRAAGVLDANGWPTEIPAGVTHIETFMLTEYPAEAVSAAGTYRLSWSGEGEITVFGAEILSVTDTEIWLDYTPTGEALLAVGIAETDPNGTGDYIRDISLVHEDNIAAFEEGEIFNPDWLAVVEDVHALRFMDWMQTNGSTDEDWADAPQIDDYTYAGGVPVEVMVALSNATGTEPWFNMPFGASEDYIETFATYVRDTLDPDLRAHYEFSNEVWNFTFPQAHASAAEGVERFGEALPDGWMQNYGARAAEMADVLDEVYAGQEDALVKVFATHTGWPGLEDSALNAPAWQAMGNPPPSESFDTYAVTGYFDGALGREKADTVREWIEDSQLAAESDADELGLTGSERDAYVEAHRYDMATPLALQELRDGSITGNPDGSLAALSEMFEYHAAVAEAHDLSMVMYEGGTHVVGIGENATDPELAEFFQHLNYSDGMGDLYGELLESWDEAGGTLFNAFVDVAPSSQWGSWGSLRYLEDDTARFDELMAFNDTNPRPWDDPDGGAVGGDPDTDPDDDDDPDTDDDGPGLPPLEEEEDPPEEDEEDEDDSTGGSSGAGSCFVATAAYQNAWHPDVVDLRRLRDEHLVRTAPGRAFVAFYWRVGPVLAVPVRRSPGLSLIARTVLSVLVRLLRRTILRRT
ncbi:hypothetical protein GGQ68_003463 [Sagittula marina]|uniref:Cellulose-binding domain protein n=1 Tax=Sagittula marina TaxID=943940 RepID=A0A7W6DUG1_9RHOB|nr:CFI-box-CTERM domain-containing protein [Sagittula marina]MBB3987117.1 hypothetical protein [Sagittula marina]